MGWVIGLVLQLVSGGDALTQGILNMSLKEALQEYVVCRKDFEDHQKEFEAAMTIEEPSGLCEVCLEREVNRYRWMQDFDATTKPAVY